MLNGTGDVLGTNEAAGFQFAGALPGKGALLALPMVSVPMADKNLRMLVAADPYFSVLFKPTALEWTYLAKPGLENGCEKRAVITALHTGTVEESLACFFRCLLPDVPPGVGGF